MLKHKILFIFYCLFVIFIFIYNMFYFIQMQIMKHDAEMILETPNLVIQEE
jgi:hypothetical protein